MIHAFIPGTPVPPLAPTVDASGVAEGVPVAHEANGALSKRVPNVWTITVPAPFVKPVVKRKTGKVFNRQPFLNSNDRDSWRVTNPIKNGWITNAITAATEADLPKGLARIRIDGDIIKPRGGDYDAMNYYPTAKALVDGLTRYGLTVDDSNKYVSGPFLHEGGKGENAITITITEEQA